MYIFRWVIDAMHTLRKKKSHFQKACGICVLFGVFLPRDAFDCAFSRSSSLARFHHAKIPNANREKARKLKALVGLVVVSHLQAGSLESTLDVEALVGLGTVENAL